MEITKQWIAKVAGWKANKAGKELFAKGAVLASTEKNNIVTGTLKSGAKPTRVTVKIHSEIDIDTVCPRLQCRRTGEICEHAVALMLHAISDETPEAAKLPSSDSLTPPQNSSSPSIPFDIHLPPNFPQTLFQGSGKIGGLSIKLTQVNDQPDSPSDRVLSQWLTQATKQSTPTMLGLRGAQAIDFLSMITAHPRIYTGDKKVVIDSQHTRIPMSLELEDDRIKVQFSEHIITHCSIWHHDDQLFLWDNTQKFLAIHTTDNLWKSRYWERLADGNSVFLPIKEFLATIETQDQHIIWDDDSELSSIPISVAEPVTDHRWIH